MQSFEPIADFEVVAQAGHAHVVGLDDRRVPRRWRWLRSDRPVLSSKVAIDLLRVTDCGLVLLVGWLAFLAVVAEREAVWSVYFLIVLLGAVLLVNVLQAMEGYNPTRVRRPLAHLQDCAGAVLLVASILVALAFFTGTSADSMRVWALAWIVSAFVALVAVRVVLDVVLKRVRPTGRSGWLRRNIAIVGTVPDAAKLIADLRKADDPYLRLVGVYSNEFVAPTENQAADIPVAGSVADLCTLARTLTIDKIYVAMPWSGQRNVLEVLGQLDCLPVDVRLQLPAIGDRLLNRSVSYVQGMPFINVADRPLGDWGYFIKWIEDRAVALAALVVLSPLLALIALAIKIDSPGPVLFRQKRHGFNNGLIEVLKFRTMRQNMCDANGSRLTSRSDPRVTTVGRLLRRSSLDELPQLLNVLRGEMSIVGPRPHAIEAKAADRYYQDIVAGYATRHKVKPGITGWAQVNGWRGPTETEEQLRKRVEHDLYYLDRWSLAFDLKIILMTMYRGFVDKNAY